MVATKLVTLDTSEPHRNTLLVTQASCFQETVRFPSFLNNNLLKSHVDTVSVCIKKLVTIVYRLAYVVLYFISKSCQMSKSKSKTIKADVETEIAFSEID